MHALILRSGLKGRVSKDSRIRILRDARKSALLRMRQDSLSPSPLA
jgi:hypothetical protein